MTVGEKEREPVATARVSTGARAGLVVEKYGVIVAWVAVSVFFCVMRPDTFAQTATIRLILSTQTVVLVAALALMLTLAVGELDLSIGSVVGVRGGR